MDSQSETNTFRLKLTEENCKIRQNPQSYIPILKQLISYFKGDIIYKPGQRDIQTNEGTSAVLECIEFLKKQSPLGAVSLDYELSKASQGHADDIGPKGICSHQGSDGSTADDRISRYVDWESTICENIDFGSDLAQDVIVSLIVDDGVSSRGHRMNIFNPDVHYIGVGKAAHTEYGNVTVLSYCGRIAGYKNKAGSVKTNHSETNNQNQTANNDHANQSNNNTSSNLANVGSVATSNFDHRKVWNEGLLNSDPDTPKNAVGVSVRTVTKTVKGRTVKKCTKTYTLDDGSVEIIEETSEY